MVSSPAGVSVYPVDLTANASSSVSGKATKVASFSELGWVRAKPQVLFVRDDGSSVGAISEIASSEPSLVSFVVLA